jgi:histone deacetylase HOS3
VGRIDEGSEQTPPPTAASVASAYFRRELDMHSWTEEAAPPKRSKAIVILHDSCYGHRYSRPRTSKASLNSIVERPERLLASILGVAAAYVRLGGRHADGKFPPKCTSQSMADFPFRIHKTTRSVSLASPAVTNVHGLKWMEELRVMCDHAEAKLAMNGKELMRPEMKVTGTDKEERPKFHEGDLYLCSDTLEALEGAIGAVCDGVDRAFGTSGPSKAFVCIRPPGHHCSSSYPSGFCWINNVNIGISHASIAHGLTHAAIIDFDLHHGDGSQAITWAHNARTAGMPKNAANLKRPSLGYFSLHDINSYPCEMGDEEKIRNASLCLENAHGQTIWNVHLQPWKDETEFWKLYESRYTVLIDKARDFLRAHTQRMNTSTTQLQPKAAIFLSSGFDASQWESPGMQRHKVNVPTEFYARFTRDVVKLSEEDGTGVNGRVISVLEGGYSDRALCSGVLSHLSGLVGGDPVPEFQDVGLRAEMSKRLGTINAYERNDVSSEPSTEAPYSPDWWALPQLMELESLVNPPPPPPAPKKPRNTTPPTYTTPTQSFTAKIISSPKVRRSVSGTAGSASPRVVLSRPPSPIYPDVDWATAAHELSKLLIPTERQTKSWRPEDLSAEAQRIKRERHSVVGLPDVQAGDGTRRSLRERKIRAPTPAVEEEEDDIPIKRENRRNTFAGAELMPEKASTRGPASAGSGAIPIRQSGRRISVSSNAGLVGSDALKQASSDISKSQSANGPSSRISSRSASTTSIRAGSSMSIRGEGNGSLIKKSGVPNQTKMEPPKARGTRKQPSASHHTLSSSESVTSRRPTTSGNSAASDSSGPVRSKPEDDRELENLTSAVKKITLHVPSREEHDMREKKRMEEKRGAQKLLRKTAAPKTSKITTIKNPEAKEPISDTISLAFNDVGAIADTPQNATVEAGVRSRQISPLQSRLAQTAAPTNGDSNSASIKFIPYTEDALQVHSHTPKAPLVWMPVNQNTPPPVRKGDLPVFTATSPITFAKAGVQASLGSKLHTAQGLERGNVVREGGGESCIASVKDEGIVSNSDAIKEGYCGKEGTSGTNESGAGADVWDVPITPKH